MAVRFLDDVIEVNQFPLPQIAEMTRKTSKIGLGVMGFADMLIQLAVPYNSEKALEIAEKVMRFISEEATAESVALGNSQRPFPCLQRQHLRQQGRPQGAGTPTGPPLHPPAHSASLPAVPAASSPYSLSATSATYWTARN